MTVEKAKNILGKYSQSLTDTEIQSIIDCFNGLIEVGLRQFERSQQIQIDTKRYETSSTKVL